MFILQCIGNMKLSKFKLVRLTFRVLLFNQTKQIIDRFLAFTCDDQPPFYQATLFVLAEADGLVLLPTLTFGGGVAFPSLIVSIH
ncbi:hypothetical protein BLOT_012112 [Blomia tropicalis]|nr:hypothetical protein BLOT_012112 [Blomia tropicalis]